MEQIIQSLGHSDGELGSVVIIDLSSVSSRKVIITIFNF